MADSYAYPFDPTGGAVTNKITKEQHSLIAPTWKDYHYLVPTFAPFFGQGLVVRNVTDNNRIMDLGREYQLAHRFIEASKACAYGIYGSIVFYDFALDDLISIDYQTLGGEWTQSANSVTAIMSANAGNPRRTSWEQVAQVPRQFPVIDHEFNLTDMVGMSSVRDSITGLIQAVRDKTVQLSPIAQLATRAYQIATGEQPIFKKEVTAANQTIALDYALCTAWFVDSKGYAFTLGSTLNLPDTTDKIATVAIHAMGWNAAPVTLPSDWVWGARGAPVFSSYDIIILEIFNGIKRASIGWSAGV